MNANLKRFERQMGEIADALDTISATAMAEDRELTAEESAEVLNLKSKFEGLEALADLERRRGPGKQAHHLTVNDSAPVGYGRGGVVAIEKGQTLATVLGGSGCKNSFGEFARVLASGRPDEWTPQPIADVFATQLTAPDSAGGVFVPEIVSRDLIDLARAKMTILAAGSREFAMESQSVVVPRVDQDPTMAAVAENDPITISDAVFGEAKLLAKKLAGIVNASNEVVMDGLGFTQALTMSMAGAIAVGADAQLLNGDGTGENILGLLNDPDVNATAITGPVTRAAIDAAVQRLRESNHEPNAVILSPANYHALANVVSAGDGQYLAAPETSEDLEYFPSSTCPDDKIVVGDFTRYLVGWREMLRLEMNRLNSTSWNNDGTSFRAIVRLDGIAGDPSAFEILTGITVAGAAPVGDSIAAKKLKS